jgi:hypothetical protein
MKEYTEAEKQNSRDYEKAGAKQFGNLHERMQFLMVCAKTHGEKTVPTDIWNAIWDLEAELRHYKPINPPFGKRIGYKSSNLR